MEQLLLTFAFAITLNINEPVAKTPCYDPSFEVVRITDANDKDFSVSCFIQSANIVWAERHENGNVVKFGFVNGMDFLKWSKFEYDLEEHKKKRQRVY